MINNIVKFIYNFFIIINLITLFEKIDITRSVYFPGTVVELERNINPSLVISTIPDLIAARDLF